MGGGGGRKMCGRRMYVLAILISLCRVQHHNKNGHFSTDPGCIYKGVQYQQGDVWDDGCDFTCTCEDGAKRQFVCRPK